MTRWVLVSFALLGIAGCEGCGGSEASPPGPSDRGPVTLKEPAAEPGDSAGNPAYQEAYNRAHEEITIENARERLNTLKREIEEDRKK